MKSQKLCMDRVHLLKILACFAVFLIFWIIPPVAPITSAGMKLIGVFIGTILLLSTVDTLWPVFFSFALISLTGVMTLNEVLSASIGNWIITFVIMSFVLTEALNRAGFTNRLAAFYMSRKFVSKNPWIFTYAFMALGMIVGMFMDQVPATAFFLGFANKILKELGYTGKDRYANVLTLGVVFAINIGGAATPISHSLALLGMGIYETASGTAISMFDYMVYGIPVAIVLFTLLCIVVKLLLKPNVEKFENFDINKVLDEIKPMDLREKITVIVFFGTVLLWMLPGILSLFLAKDAAILVFLSKYSITFWALIAVVILSVVQVNKEPVLNLKNVMEDKFPWGIIFFIAVGVLLGSAMSNENVGLNEFIIKNLEPIILKIPEYAIVFILALVSCMLTNFASNVTTITIMTGVAISIAVSTGAIHPMAVAITTTMNGSLAYVMPSSFAPIAMLHADDNSKNSTIIKYGILFVVLSALITTFIGYPLIKSLM
ncbi:SLC13 family permease [Miniphocaeibacter massiliensis]|uniref:SLC13 family permease n=1 Tax=Miniphocaeibacter massiliensis TaxID=2041841 RepID=UPI000C1C4EF2|nr:SLC13 family permease [Miniphocaeibacter massiliensis]